MAKQSWFQRLKARWKEALEEYGTIALVTWFSVFGLTIAGFGFAIESGMDPGEVLGKLGMDPARAASVGSAGKWGIAYGLTQLTKPARIAIVLVLTPLVAKVWYRVSGRTPPLAAVDDDADDTTPDEAAPTGSAPAGAE